MSNLLSGLVVSAFDCEDIPFLEIFEDGSIVTRHRGADGCVHEYTQHNGLFPEILDADGDLDLWHIGTLGIPESARPSRGPGNLAVLCRSDCAPSVPIAIAFAPLGDAAARKILRALPLVSLLFHDSTLTINIQGSRRIHPQGLS